MLGDGVPSSQIWPSCSSAKNYQNWVGYFSAEAAHEFYKHKRYEISVS